MKWQKQLERPKLYGTTFLKWLTLSILVGILGGLAGSAFHYLLNYVNKVRAEYWWMVLLLPLAGLIIVWLYRRYGMEDSHNTNELIDAFADSHDAPLRLGPLIFISTAITHLFGGSSGREGAALQIGSTVGEGLGRLLHLKQADRSVLMVSGMSAVFSAVFGTPVAASLFSLEFVCVGTIFSPGLLPCFVAALIASLTADALGVAPTRFTVDTVLTLNVSNLGRVLVLAIAVAMVGIIFCTIMHQTGHFLQHRIANPYVRILVGGVTITLLTLLLGADYNGPGGAGISAAISGQAKPWDWSMKILFTAITLGAGFKGGEIVPTFYIASTFGCALAPLLGLAPGLAASLSMVGLFCCVTNSPITALLLGIEVFGSANLLPFTLMCMVGYLLSGYSGLYTSQRIVFSKISTETINVHAK